MHPTKTIRTQAESLANTLDISDRETEAYLHWYITGDETTHKDIANWMGISPSMATRHLQNAKDYIETPDNTDKANALRQFLIRTNVGRAAEKTHSILEATFETNTFVVITEQTLSSHSESYQIHIGQNGSHSTDYIDNMPDTMTLPDTWNLTTITASTLTELLEHTEYHLQNEAAVQYDDDMYVTLFHVFKNTPVTSEWLSEKAVSVLQTP